MNSDKVYQHYLPLTIPTQRTFVASISKIDESLAHDVFRWMTALGPTERNFKQSKFDSCFEETSKKRAIHRPEFFYGRNGLVDIRDGRHRIYALREQGYDGVEVSCDATDFEALSQIIGY